MMLSSKKPVIGINLELMPASGNMPGFSFISNDYTDAIERAGGIPFLLPPVSDVELVKEYVDRCSGFMFIGGPDLDPINDNFERHTEVRLMPSKRETFDRLLMNEIVSKHIPVMGIGVGLQLLNVVAGGTLYYHIPEDLPRAVPHFDLHPTSPLRHRLCVEKGSLLYSVYGDNEVRVNSNHHMSIDDVAAGFIASAYCPGYKLDRKETSNNSYALSDGSVVEAIESNIDDWFAFGVQFHPESRLTATDLDQQLFDRFITGVNYFDEIGLNMLTDKPREKNAVKRHSKTHYEKLSVKVSKNLR